MPRRHWWNNSDDIEIVSSNHTGPLDQSSPRGFRLNELDNDSITEDLEDSLLRLNTVRQHENILNELDQVPSEVESIVSPSEPEICTDVRGRKITVTEDIPLTRTRSRSKTPFKIRDNLSHLFGWDKLLDTDPEYEEEASEVEGEGTDTPQPVEEYPKLKYWKPCSRLALLDNDQFSAFSFELSLIKNHINDFPLNFPWVIWITRSSKTEVKTVVENAIDLKLATKYIKGIYQECKVMVFKLGVLPKRKIPENINGISIDIQVNHDYDFDAFKDIVNMTLNGALYKPDIDLSICGVIFKRKPKYSIISCWIHPPMGASSGSNIYDPVLIFNLVEAIKGNMSSSHQNFMDSAVIVDNKTLSTTGVYH